MTDSCFGTGIVDVFEVPGEQKINTIGGCYTNVQCIFFAFSWHGLRQYEPLGDYLGFFGYSQVFDIGRNSQPPSRGLRVTLSNFLLDQLQNINREIL